MTIPKPTTLSGEFIIKLVVACAMIAIGVAGGMYAGGTLLGNSTSVGESSALRNTSNLTAGESLPAFDLTPIYTSAEPTETSASSRLSTDVTGGQAALFLFVSPGCHPCELLSERWREDIAGAIHPDIQVVAVYGSDEIRGPADAKLFDIPNSIPTHIQPEEAYRTLGISDSPTILAVRDSGAIAWVSSGFSPAITAEFINQTL